MMELSPTPKGMLTNIYQGSRVGGDDNSGGSSLPVLEARIVYILMSKDHREVNQWHRRAEWFFSRFDTIISLPPDDLIALSLEEGSDFYVVSAIPRDSSVAWSPQTRHSFRYKITTRTVVTYLSRRYKIVYCIDVSPSIAAVDIQAGMVVFDGVFHALRVSLDGLMRPFYIPGSTIIFQPKIFITVITHSPFVTSINNEVILQGKLLGPSTYNEILETVFHRLNIIENKMAKMTESLLKTMTAKKRTKVEKEKTPSGDSKTAFKSSISSDFSLVDLLKQALIALSLLPENSSSGLIILTDGVVSVPDGRYLDIILSQLRYNTVSCSFVQLSSSFHPHLCHGVLPYLDLMKFISSATFGAFLTEAPEIVSNGITELNIYHLAFLAWSFQSSDKIQTENVPALVKPGEWSIRNMCFFTIRDMPIVKKLQFENTLAVDYMKVLSCRLREGFMIKDISLNVEGRYEITLTLPWKFLIHLEYVITTDKTPDSQTDCMLSLEGPYDFLHDVTCQAARSFPSIYRQLMVNRFWATRKNLSESDRLLVHLNSFSSDPAYYSIPDSLRNGVPLFYFSSSSAVPQLQSSDFPYTQFSQFWKPVCMLDTNVWQKWMHTHRIGVILEHDHPLPKHLHCPNSAGRFQVILCRQAIMALNTLLKNSCSFVLVENHSYVTLMYHNDDDKSVPFSFYIIRVTSKPPYVVLRLAFLVGTPGDLRYKTVSSLRKEIAVLTFPQRLKEPPRWRFPSGGSINNDQVTKASWSELPCCILMGKPIEKILIRYEKVPENYCEVLMPQHSYETTSHLKSNSTSQQSTFGFKPTHPTPGTAPTIISPEMFNTVARYLHHKRWIWFFPKCVLPDFSVQDVSEMLTIITKMRLQEGFRFAYSSSGTVSMVLEVQMENKANVPTNELDSSSSGHTLVEETYLTPCVLQFVMFPPTTSLTPQFEDDLDTADENKDLFLVTECWVEPQCGKLTGCQFTTLNGLEFFEIPDKIFEINKECLLTLGAFDFLRGAPRSNYIYRKGAAELQRAIAGANSLAENNTVLIPFEFELGRVLPKCSQQTEMLFSMFFQDLSHAFSVEGKNDFVPYHERANEILYNSWTANLSESHDKEILIDQRYFSSLLTMVLSREDVTKTGNDSKFNYDDLPAWKCFVKSVDPSQQLITLVPKTLRDTKLFFLIVEKCKCVLTAAESKMNEDFSTPLNQPQCTTNEGSSGISNSKLRHRKVSEPNCCQKSASTSLVSHLSLDTVFPSIGRKRIRALSGGESAPVLKKAFTVDSSLHDSLAVSFFEEAASKYIVPKTKKTVVDDLKCSFSSCNEPTDHNRSFSVSESADQFEVEDHGGKSSMVGSLTMPLFTYDCSLSTLRNYLIFKGNQEVGDRCLDFRIFSVLKDALCSEPCDTMNDAASISSSSSSEGAPDARKLQEELEFTSSQLQDYFKLCQLSYKKAFIRSIFHSLQLGYYVSTEDLKASINLCHKNVITIDISEFLKNVCCHESLHEPCKTSDKIRSFIQRKFRDILTKRFNSTKVDSDFFYFKSNRLTQSQENVFGDFGSYFPFMEFDEDSIRKKESESCRETQTDNQWNSSSEFFNFSDISSTARRESESANTDSPLPLFLLLRCTSAKDGSSKTFTVSDLPVCKDDYDPCLREEITNLNDNDAQVGCWNTKLEFLFLTSPLDYVAESCTSEITSMQQCENITLAQSDALETMLKEVEWLLNDEITSLRSNSRNLTTEMLQEIASHVQKSAGKSGCFQQVIPLQFVENSTKGHEKFVEQFDRLWLPGFEFKNLENWWYLRTTTGAKKIMNLDGNCDYDVFDKERSDSLQRSIDESEPSTTCTTSMSENEFQLENRLPFWILFRVEADNVFSYCHVRYDEEDLLPLKQCSETRDIILQGISRLIRIVNQDLLLQSLHDSRLCSPLLEPDTNRSLDEPMMYGSKNYEETLRDFDADSATTPNSTVASFACDVVWETTFKLHPRLRSGPGKSAFSRGMQILRSTLMAFEVSNRDNMFVYRNSLGNVFYLRMYRVIESYDDAGTECPSENPSPRSSISSRSRLHHPSADSNKDDPPIIMLRDVLTNLSGRTTSDGVVLLKVHGVTEAGCEIKEQLIQSLRNKLDDAVLDVLSVTLDRNPHCKLTPEDVHFIQKPLSPPDAVLRFTTGRFVKLLLPPFAFYLHQNLLQILNIPKYTKGEPEFHFQDYHRMLESRCNNEDHNVYLYNQSPGGTGSRGVACVSVSLVDRHGTLLRCRDWKRPWNFQFSLSTSDLCTFIETEEILDDTPMSDIVLELCVWKQGRINLDILKNNFLSAIKHGGWDLAMEYQILTPSLFSPSAQEDQNSIECDKDLVMGYKLPRCGSPVNLNTFGSPFPDRSLRRRNSSAVALGKIDTERYEEPRERSWSYTVRRPPVAPPIKNIRLETPLETYNSKASLRGSTASTETIRHSFDFVASRRNFVEDIDKLHPNYSSKFKKWINIGLSLALPSLRTENVKFKPQHYLDETIEEIIKIIHAASPDNSTAQFWKLEKNMRDFLTIGKKVWPEYEHVLHKVYRDVDSFKKNEEKLRNLEKKDEAEYPEELLKLFTSRECFQPSSKPSSCILIGRNLNHWEACVFNKKSLDLAFNSSDVMKSLYKFYPLMSEATSFNDDKSSLNTDKMKFPTKNGLLALLGDTSEESCLQSILVPRQRFLLAYLSRYSVEFVFYNWSKETSDKIIEQTKILATWTQCRWDLMSSVLLQKSGIYYNPPFLRETETANSMNHIHPTASIKDLIRYCYPPKHSASDRGSNNKNLSDTRSQISDLYRNLHHTHLLRLHDTGMFSPIIVHGEQLLELLSQGRNDLESSLFRYWLSRGPSASNVIGKEAIEALKQTARMIHYCMTPIFFLPRWRTAISFTRDSSSGIFKRARVVESNLPALLNVAATHDQATESSLKNFHSKEKPNLPIWSLWKRLQSERYKDDVEELDIGGVGGVSRSPKRSSNPWHAAICSFYIQEYLQYLQTLGFIPAQGINGNAKRQSVLTSDNWAQSYVGRLERMRRMSDGSVLSADSDKSSRSTSPSFSNAKLLCDTEDKVFYLQKSLPGGIILLEVGFVEPFSYCKIHALEVHRIQGKKFAQRAATSHNTIAFVDECDKMKVLMHLHSFAYDFHLRSIQNHICGKQVIKQGYHVTKFLDDFISYYCKGPNFARSTVNIGVMSLQNISTPSHIMFDYVLTHNKKYEMAVLRMNQLNSNKIPEQVESVAGQGYDYALVYTLSKKVAYRESEDESHLGEFEMSLVISHDVQPGGRGFNKDPSVLRIKYYIVLTSRRELYPNLAGDLNSGKLFPVSAPEPLSDSSIREIKRKSFDEGGPGQYLIDDVGLDTGSCGSEKDYSGSTDSSAHNVIREEKVHYMGYFSSHEQMMQEILKEQTIWAEHFIRKMVEAAAVDCRIDLLWQRLQVGGKKLTELTAEKDELTLRETVGVLTFWEFSELLELIHIQPLRALDPQLETLLNQPTNFFQTLIKLLSNVNNYEHRYFAAPDGKIHQLVIINPNSNKCVVLIEINIIKHANDISILYKDNPEGANEEVSPEIDPEILNLIETAVGACCYCNFLQLTQQL